MMATKGYGRRGWGGTVVDSEGEKEYTVCTKPYVLWQIRECHVHRSGEMYVYARDGMHVCAVYIYYLCIASLPRL